MAFSRLLAPPEPIAEDTLTADMTGIGMGFAAARVTKRTGAVLPQPNIEDTLLSASVEGMEKHDLRVLAILITWFCMHAAWVNADRLTRLVSMQRSQRVRAFWAALARLHAKDRRFARLARLYAGLRQDVTVTGTEFQIKRHGEDTRFEGSPLRVAANVLRERPADVLSPADLAQLHHAYRWRVIIGPTYRADMWAALEDDRNLSAAALAKQTYGSFATAWRVRRDFGLVEKIAVGRNPMNARS